MDSAASEEYDRRMIRNMENMNLYKVPLDQGSFDNRQSKRTIHAVFLALRDGIYSVTCDNMFLEYYKTYF